MIIALNIGFAAVNGGYTKFINKGRIMLKLYAKGLLVTCCLLPLTVLADGLGGNRYSGDDVKFPRAYHSEISAASAYLSTQGRGHHRAKHPAKAIIIDVRTIEEYVGGHPPKAYSIPYPHIYNRQHNPDKGDYIGQTPEDFVVAVDALDLPKDTLIITMCRTGARSVWAGNLLADAGYKNVRNMWQGFKGKLMQNTSSEYLDLDGNGVVDGDDPYSGDLDGWANFQGLPVSYKLKHKKLHKPYMSMYYNVTGER